MKITKKCGNTQTKISIKEKLDELRNRRRSSAGMFYTSSAGAVTSLILMVALGITGATNLLGLGGSASAADNISLTVDTNNLTINMAPMSSSGDFAKSGNMNIGVSTTSTSGYTLSIASSTGSTDLTNQSDNTKKINSLSSAISESDFSNSSNTQYNNKWGYKPSQYVTMNGDDPVIHPNTNYRPLPGTSGEIIAKTSVANPTADNYTISIGTRASASTTLGTYISDTFVITAVTNFTGLTIIYDGNGLYFNNDPTQTTNSVIYDATKTSDGPYTEKYSHTPNISDDGTVNGKYDDYGAPSDRNDVITIPGASTLHVKITYATESTNYDWAVIWSGSHSDYSAKNNYSSGITCNGAGPKLGNTTITTKECNITGDAVTFGFYNDDYKESSGTYGYYAVITGYDGSGNPVPYYIDTYSKSVVSGAYATPGMNTGVTEFMGWSENASDTTPTYINGAEVSAKLPAVNGDPDVTLYAIYEHADTAMQNMSSSQCTTAGVKVYDNRDNSIYLVKKLADGKCWMLDNLRLDLGNSTVLNNTTESNTNASTTTLNYLKNGGGSTSDRYPTAKINNVPWTSSSQDYYSIPMTISTYKDQTTTSYGEGSGKIGVYYNYCAASAGNYCFGNGTSAGSPSGNATEDICPKGWRMPTGGSSGEYKALYTAYSSGSTSFRNALSTPLSGNFYSGSANYQGTLGYFWSSTYSDANYMYILSVDSSSVSPSNVNSRYNGRSVRCLLGS